jgi:predicted PurR-regulated permease PerM
MFLPSTPAFSGVTACFLRGQGAPHQQALFVALLEHGKGNIYNILWALVFGFATLNILSLLGRRFEPERSRLTFGEMLAILVVVMSVVLLGMEFMHMFKIFPIKLGPR